MYMTIFEALFLGHLVGDFLFQNRWMAKNKNKHVLPRLVHSIIYTIAVYTFSWLAGGISPISAGIILLSHFYIDQRSFTRWWLATINRTSGIQWLNIVCDQIFHLLILACIVYFKF
jgi:hypothetical protein